MNAPARRMTAAIPQAEGGVELREVSKRFGGTHALSSVSLSAKPGEILAVTGSSGAGKTTLCRVVAGLETPDAGSCRIGGFDVAGVPPGARRVAYMFESYALYPHMTVRANVLSPVMAPNGGGRRTGSVPAILDLLEIGHLADRLPAELSGGQKQRVALARTLVQEPAVTLLDEPLSHLDAKLRHKLRGELRRMLVARPSPTLWCTPDAVEALCIGDRIAVIEAGRIEQVATPEELWLRPATLHVARLVGDPPMNLLPGRVERASPKQAAFACPGLRIPLSARLAEAAAALGDGAAVTLGIRPHLLAVAQVGTASAADVELYSHEPFGKYAIVTVRLGDTLIKAKTAGPAPVAIGATAGLLLPDTGFVLFDTASGNAIGSDAASLPLPAVP